MGNPKYRVKASGMGGSGYARPPAFGEPFKMVKNADGEMIAAVVDESGQAVIVPGVTTVIKRDNNEALIQWSVNQTAAFATQNLDLLMAHDEDWGYKFLRFQANRKSVDVEDPLTFAYKRVLNDLAELGTNAHDYLEYRLWPNGFPPTPHSAVAEQMFRAIDQFLFMNDVRPIMAEETAWGNGYAGTFDHILELNGERALVDAKTSRRIGEYHRRQVAALHYAPTLFLERDGLMVEAEKPKYEKLGFLQIRPDDDEGPARVVFHEQPMDEIELLYGQFRDSLGLAQKDAELKKVRKNRK